MVRTSSRAQPLRTCRMCRQILPKSELERWVLRGNELILDHKGVEPGRGWYSCKTPACSRRMHEVGSSVARSRRHRPPKTKS